MFFKDFQDSWSFEKKIVMVVVVVADATLAVFNGEAYFRVSEQL